MGADLLDHCCGIHPLHEDLSSFVREGNSGTEKQEYIHVDAHVKLSRATTCREYITTLDPAPRYEWIQLHYCLATDQLLYPVHLLSRI